MLDDGSHRPVENPRCLGRSEDALKTAYRARDTKHKFSRGWRLANQRVAHLHAKIAQQRLDFHHKESTKLLAAAGAVFTETLHV